MPKIPLTKHPLNGRGVYATPDGKFLIKKNEETGQWQAVESFTRDLNEDDLTYGYALWKDRRIEKDYLFWVKTVRDYDGKCQPDEVDTFWSKQNRETYTYETNGDTRWTYGWLETNHKITGTETGRPILSHKWYQSSWSSTSTGFGGI